MEEYNVNERTNAYFNIYMGKEAVANNQVLLAITYFKHALHFFREASQTEATEEVIAQDTRDIHDTLCQLIHAINTLINSSIDATIVINELERFLTFYVGTYKVLNEKTQRLPWLTELNLQDLVKFWKKLSDETDKARVEIYVAIVSLFHEELKSQRTIKDRRSDPAVVKKAVALHRRALAIAPESEPEPAVQPKSEFPVTVAPLPQRVVQPPKVQARRYAHQFDMFAPEDKKRQGIRRLMENGEYAEALRAHGCVSINHSAEDYRCAAVCQQKIGNDHFGKNVFQSAIECYIESLRFYSHMLKGDIIDNDQDAIADVFRDLTKAFNEITREWPGNFEEAGKSIEIFLHFYLDYFEAFHSNNKKLPGLDGIDMNNLIPFLGEIGDETQKEITKMYLAIIGMFSQDAKLDAGGLMLTIREIEAKEEVCQKDSKMKEVFNLFQQACNLVNRIKGHDVLNPDVSAGVEQKRKRHKAYEESSSSSSLPPYGLGVSPVVSRRDNREEQVARMSIAKSGKKF